MAEDICPICKEAVHHLAPFIVLETMGKRRVYHTEPCFRLLAKRIDSLWGLLTGPQEDFDAWLEDK
jgi:hypothetical protein